MRDIVVTLVVFGLLPLILRQPKWGIYVSAWLGYMNPHRLCWSFAYSMPFVMITAIATIIGMISTKEKLRVIWTRETILLLMFMIWMGITTSQAFFFDLAWAQYIKVIKIQILTVLAILALTSRERLHMFIWVICLSLGFFGIKGGIFTIIHGGIYRVQGPEGSFIGGNNEMALALVMTIPLMRYLHLQEKRPWLKTGLAAAMILTAIATIGSQSRGALVGIVVMGTIFWLKSRNKVMTAIMIAVSVGSVAAIMPQEWYDRMNTVKTYEQDESAQGRINAWWTAFNVAKGRITGGGFETFRAPVFRQYAPDPGNVHDVHSIYFEVMGEHGFIGFAMFMMLMAFAWMRCNVVIKYAKKDRGLWWAMDLAAMVQVSIIGYAAAGAFLGLAYFDFFYHLVVISVIVDVLIRAESPVKELGGLPKARDAARRFGAKVVKPT